MTYSTPKRTPVVILLSTVLLVLAAVTSVPAQVIRDILADHQHLSYNGYDITISRRKRGDKSTTLVRKGSRILGRWVNRNTPINDWSSRTGLFRLLKTRTKQLVIQQFSGGAHCCLSWRIYDLHPSFRLIFDSEPYPIEDSMDEAELVDIDRDGTFELKFYSNRFSYFNGSCFACLPRPPVVFRYDAEAGRYLPANHVFRGFALRGVGEELKRIDELRRTRYEDSFPYVLDVVLRYVYAGMQGKAWRLFEWHYSTADDRAMELKIKRHLRGDGVYRSLYRTRRKA